MAYDITEYNGRSADYKAKRQALAEKFKAKLESEGFYVEETREGELSISFTRLGLDGVYATIGLDELEYHLDNMEDEDEDNS